MKSFIKILQAIHRFINDKRGEYNPENNQLFNNYPDIVNIDQLRQMLGGICKNKAYELVRSGKISALPCINTYKIPKINVINFIIGK